MVSEPPDPSALRGSLAALLPAAVNEAVAAVIAAAPAGAGVFAVGGSVRDLFLGRPLVDLDLTIEGDAPAVLRAALPRARITGHARFGTASTVLRGVRIDVATARTETYARPGALPETAPATIEADLARRDFSCNALALRLSGKAALLDPSDGIADIAAKRIRVLHDRSFVDDPTRVFRAFRYAARLEFVIEPRTAALLASGLPRVRAVSGERLRREVELMLADTPPGAALEAAHTAGALQALQAALHWSAAKSEAYAAGGVEEKALAPYGFALLASGTSPEQAEGVVRRLRLKRDEAAAVRGVAALRAVSDLLRRPDLKPSGAAMLLDRYPRAAIGAYARTTGNAIAREIMLRYLEEWRDARPILSGRDLIEMGVPEGPQVQRGLQLVRAARIDGWARDRDDERALILRYAKSIRDSAATHSLVEFEPGDE
ncbi:MAG: CCA tRNA nucleotidyltransferase [Chloroflexota bacterium]|nr:CCA tRNA nucleotidyltransferase [Chloroflexota bacterium]